MQDNRYTIAREWCGAETPQHVARFCGQWISGHNKRPEALQAIEQHKAERDNILRGLAA